MAERGSVKNMAWQTSGHPAAVNPQQLTEAVITALTQWNAAALDILSRQASSWIENPPASHSLAAAVDQHRLLGALLQETERNLRMFRETSPCAELRSGTGVYESHWS
jgi:hypothetical protein